MYTMGVIKSIGSEISVKEKSQRAENEERDLRKACSDFESILIYNLLQSMRKTIPKGGLFSEKSASSDTYTMLFDQRVAEDLSKRGGVGLQKMLYSQLSRPDRLNNK